MAVATRTKRIDTDSHFFPRIEPSDLAEALNGAPAKVVESLTRDATVFAQPNARRGGFQASAAGQRLGGGHASNVPAAPRAQAVGHGDVEERAALLPETGFEMQVLIPDGIFANPFGSPVGREFEPGLRLALCRGYNDATARAQLAKPEVFIGTAIVPFGDVGESCAEARRAVAGLGLKAITINGNWRGHNYDSVELYPFWETVSELGVPLYVHHNPFACQVSDHMPTTYTLGWERMRRLHISNYLGFAFEYMVGMAALTLGGVLQDFPSLKFCFFEAGGSWLPWVMYTLDRVYKVEPQCARCDAAPSELIRDHCLVAVEPDEEPLVQAVAAIGSENFIIGSDYPHPPSTYPNTAAGIEAMALSEEAKANILGGNAERLFGLE
jgi:predicted TIM-barrel fold metal-dependent hydrolase